MMKIYAIFLLIGNGFGGVGIKSDLEPDIKLITEGETSVWVADLKDVSRHVGPGTAKVPVFYNPVMEFSRDLSILVIEKFLKDLESNLATGAKVKLLDGLAGTGIRGVRMGNEVACVKAPEVTITINDYNPLAYQLIKKNIELNKLTSANATNNDLNALLTKKRFNYIDIDPFGSPIKFLDAGCRMLRNNGILAVTATDTATLFGSHPKTCLRRYDTWSCKTGFGHEVGVRILIACCVRTAARYNIGLKPLLSHATDYYYRVYLRGVKGRSSADNSLAELGYLLPTEASNEFKIINRKDLVSKSSLSFDSSLFPSTGVAHDQEFKLAGPLWSGWLYDHSFLNNLQVGAHKLGTEYQVTKMLALWRDEAEAPIGFYDANLMASELKVTTPPLQKIIKTLTKHGYRAVRTHFNPNAFKTDAAFEDIAQILKNI